jgi:hypothetical protein
MIDLKALPHTETLVPIMITRLGEERSTRYQISPSEAKSESAAKPYDTKAVVLASDFLRRRYGHIYESKE